MVVLSIAVVSKSGKVIVSRQYVEMTRIRIEGILAAFPKLIDSGSESSAGKQHTYVETGSIRYVYQPIEGLYLVLVTTRGSNIVQDLDTLRLLSKVLPEYSQVNEEDISRNVFDLVFAFDEVITLGYKENITLQGIRTNLEMDSHEEKLHLMIKQSKMNEAKDQMRQNAARIQKERTTQPLKQMEGIGPDSSDLTSLSASPSITSGGGSGMDPYSSSTTTSDSRYGGGSSSTTTSAKSGLSLKMGGKGMSLGGNKNKGFNIKALAEEEGYDPQALMQQQSQKANVAAPGAVVRTDPIEVRVQETVFVVYDKDGGLQKIEIKGSIQLLCHEESSKIKLLVEPYGDLSIYTFQPHPNLSKADWQSNHVLQMKNTAKSFPKDKSLGILKWRYMSKDDEAMVPLRITCWPESNGDGTMTVNVEAELLADYLALANVIITIPLNTSETPEVTNLEGGVHRHNSRRHLLEWELGLVDKDNSTGNLEFIVPGNNETDFFPVTIQFDSEHTICPLHVSAVENIEDGEPAKFGLYKQLQVDRYEIVAEGE